MAKWAGGFSGVGFDREEFKKWLKSQKKPPYQRIVVHNTAAPYVKPPVSPSSRIINLANYYKNQLKWSGGPDFFVIFDKIYLGSPLGHSVGCVGWNGNSFHLEVEGDYDGTNDPKTEPGLTAWKTAGWAMQELLEWMGWPVDAKRIMMHREAATDDDPKTRTTHDCPGKLVTKDWVLMLAGGMVEAPEPAKPLEVTQWVNTPGDTLNFRDGPAGRKKSVLPHGLKVHVLGYDANWAHVSTPAGYQGWVYRQYLSPTDPNVTTKPKPEEGGAQPAPEPVKPGSDGMMAPGQYKYSQFCVDWAKRFEALMTTAYWDVGDWAIGYGHNNGSGVPPSVKKGDTITPQEAERVLMSDLDLQLHYLEAYVDVPLTQGQVDALILHIFQQGPGNFREGRVRPLVNAGKHAEAAEAIKNWPTAKAGLIRRRAVEADIYAGGKPTKW